MCSTDFYAIVYNSVDHSWNQNTSVSRQCKSISSITVIMQPTTPWLALHSSQRLIGRLFVVATSVFVVIHPSCHVAIQPRRFYLIFCQYTFLQPCVSATQINDIISKLFLTESRLANRTSIYSKSICRCFSFTNIYSNISSHSSLIEEN